MSTDMTSNINGYLQTILNATESKHLGGIGTTLNGLGNAADAVSSAIEGFDSILSSVRNITENSFEVDDDKKASEDLEFSLAKNEQEQNIFDEKAMPASFMKQPFGPPAGLDIEGLIYSAI